jgi:hypothetical protein
MYFYDRCNFADLNDSRVMSITPAAVRMTEGLEEVLVLMMQLITSAGPRPVHLSRLVASMQDLMP